MITIVHVVFIVIAALIVWLFCLDRKFHKRVSKNLSEEILNGVVQHEARALLKSLQNGIDENKIFLPLRNLVNVVVVYKQLGGNYDKLNVMLETIRTTITTKSRPIYPVNFGGGVGGSFNDWLFQENRSLAWVDVWSGSTSRRLYHFDETHTNSLEFKEEYKESSSVKEN